LIIAFIKIDCAFDDVCIFNLSKIVK
jgi:hypothetical protein